jgi:hypothetical protein
MVWDINTARILIMLAVGVAFAIIFAKTTHKMSLGQQVIAILLASAIITVGYVFQDAWLMYQQQH